MMREINSSNHRFKTLCYVVGTLVCIAAMGFFATAVWQQLDGLKKLSWNLTTSVTLTMTVLLYAGLVFGLGTI